MRKILKLCCYRDNSIKIFHHGHNIILCSFLTIFNKKKFKLNRSRKYFTIIINTLIDKYISNTIFYLVDNTPPHKQCNCNAQDVLIRGWNLPILRSDAEKELMLRRREEQRKLVVKKFSETFVKNAFYFL